MLATDGDENIFDLRAMDAAQLAKTLGIRVYTIGVAPTGRGSGEVNEQLLKDMATLAGGTYNRASDENGLRNIYREIEALEKARVGSRGFIETNDASLPFVVAGTALLNPGKRTVSLRGRGVDVSTIAQRWGGGGHARAAPAAAI